MLKIVGEYSDEAASAYKGNRGAGLTAALEHASVHMCTLIVQHSDRLARGDGRTAKHLVEYALWALKAGVTIRSCQDDQTFGDLLYAVVTGQRNHEDSARKSASTRSGLARRKASGKPVGPIPLGYTWEHGGLHVETTRRVIDVVQLQVVEQIFDLVEAGSSFGAVARTLNAQGIRGKRGAVFQGRTIREIVWNEAYAGRKGYPALIDPARYDLIVGNLKRMDPAAVQRRQGGRQTHDTYLLKGIAFCRSCGAPLWTRRQAKGRVYVCSHRRLSTGVCQAATIPADLLEGHVLAHVEAFVGDAERWLEEQRRSSTSELQRLRDAVLRHLRVQADLAGERRALIAEYRRQVADAVSTARLALEAVEQVDAEALRARQLLQAAEAKVEEHDVSADEQHTATLVTTFRDRLAGSSTGPGLTAALAHGLAGLWASLEDGELTVEFELAAPPIDGVRRLLRHAEPVGLDARRVTLPLRPEPVATTGASTPVAKPGSSPSPTERIRHARRKRAVPGTASLPMPPLRARVTV